MTDYDTKLAAVVEIAERRPTLPVLEQNRYRCRCGRVNARVVNVDGHRLYVTYVPKWDATRRTIALYRFANDSGGRAPKDAPYRVQMFYALLDHPDCPELPRPWCPHARSVQLESPTVY